MKAEHWAKDGTVNLSIENIDTGGGPFGAVIVRDGEIISTGTNRVVPNSDPTAHAEVMAIRNACAKLGTFQLTGCTVYSSCEPCPMCLSALYWAGVKRICYGNTKDDAKAINFDDNPKVIISASGMCEAGRIRHHLKHNLWNNQQPHFRVHQQIVELVYRLCPRICIFLPTPLFLH
mgnify:CR=1 FL=1